MKQLKIVWELLVEGERSDFQDTEVGRADLCLHSPSSRHSGTKQPASNCYKTWCDQCWHRNSQSNSEVHFHLADVGTA